MDRDKNGRFRSKKRTDGFVFRENSPDEHFIDLDCATQNPNFDSLSEYFPIAPGETHICRICNREFNT